MLADGSGTGSCQRSTNPDDSCRLPGRPLLAGSGWMGGLRFCWLGGPRGAELVRQRAVKKHQGQLFGRTRSRALMSTCKSAGTQKKVFVKREGAEFPQQTLFIFDRLRVRQFDIKPPAST